MRSSARIWLILTQLAWFAGCSGQLPLSVPDHELLPTEFAGSGAGMRGAAGAAGVASAPWRGAAGAAVMPPPAAGRPAICGDALIQPPESCERNNLNGATCATLGFNGGGLLLCNPTLCVYDTIMCRMKPGEWGGRPPDSSGADAGTDDAG